MKPLQSPFNVQPISDFQDILVDGMRINVTPHIHLVLSFTDIFSLNKEQPEGDHRRSCELPNRILTRFYQQMAGTIDEIHGTEEAGESRQVLMRWLSIVCTVDLPLDSI